MKFLTISAVLVLLSSVNSWSVTFDSDADIENFCQGMFFLNLATRNLGSAVGTSSS